MRRYDSARPAVVPIEQPARCELVLNRKAARVLGLALQPPMLASADEVIE